VRQLAHRAYQLNDQLSPRGAGGRRGFGDAQAQITAYQQQLKAQFQQQGSDFLLQSVPPSLKQNQAQWLQFVGDIQSGNYGQAALDGEVLLITALAGTGVGLVFGAIIGAIEGIYGADHPQPCTIVGCGPTFNLPECDTFPDGRSPFTWASLASMGPAPPPPDQVNGYIPGTWLVNWGDFYWLCTPPPPYRMGINCPYGSPLPNAAGGPGSFEDGLQQALMSSWDTHATAPWLCTAMQNAGLNGQIYSPGSAGNELAIWKALFAYAGQLVPPFVAAWNATHSPGTVNVPCTQQACEAAGGTWYGGGDCSVGGQYYNCQGPAPQRKVTYGPWPGGLTASGLSTGDPLNAAFYGLALAAGLPDNATVSVMVNGGPAITGAGKVKFAGNVAVNSGGVRSLLPPKPKPSSSSTATKILTGTALTAVAAAIGTILYARYNHKPVKTVVKSAWSKTGGRIHVPHFGRRAR